VLVGRLLGFSWRGARTRTDELLDASGLAEAAGRQVRTFSGGMRRRLDIAASLVATPDLLFLDEPTTGLDPRSRNQVWDLVRAIAAEGTTVLLTTQYLEEADRLADRLAVIDRGKLIAEGTNHELKVSVGGNTLQVRLRAAEQCSRPGTSSRKRLASRSTMEAIPTHSRPVWRTTRRDKRRLLPRKKWKHLWKKDTGLII